MALVSLSIGSNIEADRHVRAALDALQAEFGELRVSSVFESEAVGFQGSNFLNLVVIVETDKALGELDAWLKQLEKRQGRERNIAAEGRPSFSGRTLDVDILTYGELVGEFDGVRLPRPEITENAYVLWPLAELWEKRPLPGSESTFGELWAAYGRERQRLWPVDFNWRGRQLSRA